MPDLSEQGLPSLRMRQQLARGVMRLLRQWNAPQDVVDHYRSQLKEITAELRARRRAAREAEGWVKPEPQVARMKVARMGTRVPTRKEDILAQARRVIAEMKQESDQ